MIKTWFLIIILTHARSGTAVSSIEFNTQSSCEAAAAQVLEIANHKVWRPDYIAAFCVRK